MTNPTPARRPRRWWKAAAIVAILVLGAVLGLPWLIGTGPGRSRVADRLNQGLAPGRLEFRSLGVSWFGPTRLGEVVLLDPKGAKVASAPEATFDRTLGQWIFGAPGTLTLTLDGAALDVQRSPDGSVDLGEALKTLIANPDPKRDLLVKIAGGSLRYRDPFLAEPSTADALDLDLRIRPSPDPVSWKLKLARGGDAGLEVQGDFDRWLARGGPPRAPELQVSVTSRRWPFVAKTAGLDASGKLDGSLDFLRRRGQWRLSGDARLLGLQATGAPLNGDTLAFDRLEAGWDVAEGDEGWSIRRLNLTTPLGDLKAEGQVSGAAGTGKQRIEGRVDLAALTRQLPHALHLRDGLVVDRGSARLTVDVASVGSHVTYDVEARVADLAARDRDRTLTLRDPATFTARFVRDGDASSLERLAVKSSFLEASAGGRLVDGVELQAALDLDKFRGQLGEWVDLGGMELAGRVSIIGTYQLLPAGSPRKMRDGQERQVFAIGPPGSPVNLSEARAAFWEREDDPSAGRPSPILRFANALKLSFRDLRIGGVVGWARPGWGETLEVRLDGPAEPSGWPLGWDRIEAWINRDGERARVQLESGARAIGVKLYCSEPPIPLTSRLNRDVFLKGEWSPESRALSIGLVRVEVGSKWVGGSIPPPPNSHLEIAARGRLDLSAGEMILEATPAASPITIAPGADGIRVSGIGRGLPALRVEGGLTGDAATIDSRVSLWTGRSPLGVSGRWSAQATARGDTDGVHLAAKIGLDEDARTAGKPARPTSVAARAHYSTGSDRLDLSEFTVSTAYGTLDASGAVEDPTGLRRVDLKGVVSPDFEAINALLARRVEPRARLDGRPRAFRASGMLGDLAGARLPGLDAEFGFEIAGADIYGMKFGPSPVVLRARGGKLAFDPISTSINEGHIRLEPELDLDAPGGPVVRLAKNSAIREARINDEVSRRVLAYVAPILDQATRARGLVSVDLDHAEFPIGLGRGRQAKVEGAVVFEDVEFAPGPLANDLLTVIGRRDASLKLDRPVTLTIADGRVNQRGMSIPVGDLTRIEMAGWVDFDRNLAITATLPVTAPMLGNNPLLTDIVAGTQVKLPIRGTLDRPVIDRDALTANLQEMGKSLLTRGATRGAMELLMRLTRPKGPNAPPPPPRITPQERKALRQEKKAIRRGEVPPPPTPDPGR